MTVFITIHLFQVVYKASLLHLQPRQMRLEITDMKSEGNEDDDADEDDDVDGLFAPEFAGMNIRSFELYPHRWSECDTRMSELMIELECQNIRWGGVALEMGMVNTC